MIHATKIIVLNLPNERQYFPHYLSYYSDTVSDRF